MQLVKVNTCACTSYAHAWVVKGMRHAAGDSPSVQMRVACTCMGCEERLQRTVGRHATPHPSIHPSTVTLTSHDKSFHAYACSVVEGPSQEREGGGGGM
eukprot:353241-Chlamydomonas_euryale.AAC.6